MTRLLADFYGDAIAATTRESLPDGYLSYRACREFFAREAAADQRMSVASAGATWGVSWRHGPFRFEKFFSDVAPAPDHSGALRLTLWQRFTATDVPSGWWRAPEAAGLRLTGFSDVADEGYERRWSAHARRHVTRWRKALAEGRREIVDLDVGAYLAAYAHADQDAFMKAVFPKVIREKAAAHGGLMRFIGSRRPGGPVDAGLGYLHVPEVVTSVHVAGFIAGDAKVDSAGAGLVAEWFARSRADGMRFMDFGFFWLPGDPRDWRGFSRFKSQFGTRLLRFPRTFMRLSGRWGGAGRGE